MATAPPTDAAADSPSASPRHPAPAQDQREDLQPPMTNDQPSSDDRHSQEEEEENRTQHRGDRDDRKPGASDEGSEEGEADESAPPLPDEVPPPLPDEAPPGEDDGWEPVWDPNAQAYYFYNRFTGVSQWENPRVPDAPVAEGSARGVEAEAADTSAEKAPAVVAGGYNPAIHGDYDPTAPYAQQYEQPGEAGGPPPGMDPTAAYAAVGAFNRFTGKWQTGNQNPEYHDDAHKSYRQMNAFFDVDAAANSHDGRSLRAERSAKKLSRKEVKMFKEKRREKKEEKRRAWLRD
ncbi:conserved hypothetical protein [Aspergillus terreus NIH2624]|uniref:WW domain-containing protein n=1 Tax=Aspergillus terreus (strain NIH 2624 / FGSC A1156) TaxID=341663 RepID=Q0CIJ0_ASPTN|nr:uncharacterized protein ATEG_06494 [Aspergillus terreus NIH2624]EAU33038.1 conserved hypothetical protein [Aspergillus terreus NIH2624]